MKSLTLIGATGLVGQEIKTQAVQMGLDVFEPTREKKSVILEEYHDHIIYCAGENKCLLETLDNVVEINSKLLAEIIKKQNFNHLTYFSSTRIYGESLNTSEDSEIVFDFNDNRALFNSSKILGESLCHFSLKPVLIVRPSNIYGVTTSSKLFLPSITRDAINNGVVNMFVPQDYEKDYINVADIASLTLKLSVKKETGVFNLATGENVRADQIASILERETGCTTIWHPVNQKVERFSSINTKKLFDLFPTYQMKKLEENLVSLIYEFKNRS